MIPKYYTMPDLPCPVCGNLCRADVVLRHAESQKLPVPNALGHSIRELRHWGGTGETESQIVMLRAAKAAEDFFWKVAASVATGERATPVIWGEYPPK